MAKPVTISVVIPAFNAAATLVDAVESVHAQTFPAADTLVVDDGSMDGTAGVLGGLQREVPNLRVLKHTGGANRGVAASRNLGVARVRGDAVVFLDADDVLLPDALATYADVFARFPQAGVVYALAESFGGGRPARLIGRGDPERSVGMLRQLARFNVIATCAAAVRRTALGAEPFPLGLPFQFEDWACWLRLAKEWPFVFLSRPVARYRVHPGSFLSGLERRRLLPDYEAALAEFLVSELAGADSAEHCALSEGLRFRAASALLHATSALRRGHAGDARRWFAAAHRIAGGSIAVAAVLPFAAQERLRIGRRLDPPLSLDPAPKPAELGVHPG